MYRYVCMVFVTSLFALSAYADESGALRAVHQKVYANYTPGPTEPRLKFYSGSRPFTSDCKGFSVAVHYQLTRRGFNPQIFLVQTREGQQHMLTCLGHVCADNNYRLPITTNEMLERYEMVGLVSELPASVLRRY